MLGLFTPRMRLHGVLWCFCPGTGALNWQAVSVLECLFHIPSGSSGPRRDVFRCPVPSIPSRWRPFLR